MIRDMVSTFRYGYKAIIGNNTFTDHTSKDMYFYYCYCTGTNAVKLFSNSYSTFSNNNGLINVYNNLNIRTLDEDDNAFSNVDLEIKDSASLLITRHLIGEVLILKQILADIYPQQSFSVQDITVTLLP